MTTTSKPRDRTAIKQAHALAVNDIERAWREWRALILERQDDLAARTAVDDMDDLLDTGARPVARKAKLSAAARQEMTGVLEARRQQAQEQAEKEARQAGQATPDPDGVYGALLTHILEELDGTHDPQGWARVYYDGQLTAFDHRTLTQTTTDDDYLGAQGTIGVASPRRQALIGVGAVLGILLLIGLVWTLLFGSTVIATVVAAPVQVGVLPMVAWTTTRAAVGTVAGAAQVAKPGAYPLTLCLGDGQRAEIKDGATITLTATDAIRVYRVGADGETAGDLRAAVCGAGVPQVVRVAHLTDTQTRRTLPPATLGTVVAWGPDTDPQHIPADQMQIDVTVPDAATPPGTLVLADGTRWSPAKTTPAAPGVLLTYLVPFSASEQHVGWELPAVTGDLPAVAALTIPVPVTRRMVLHRALSVSADQAALTRPNGASTLAVTLTLTLANDSAPLTLLAGDLTVAQNTSAVGGVTWTPPTLTPGQVTQVVIRVPVSSALRAVDVGLGDWHKRYSWEGGP